MIELADKLHFLVQTNIADQLEKTVKFVPDLFGKEKVVFFFVAISLFFLFYGLILAVLSLSQVKLFQKRDGEGIGKPGKVVAFSLAAISVFAMFSYKNGVAIKEMNKLLAAWSATLALIIAFGGAIGIYKLFTAEKKAGEKANMETALGAIAALVFVITISGIQPQSGLMSTLNGFATLALIGVILRIIFVLLSGKEEKTFDHAKDTAGGFNTKNERASKKRERKKLSKEFARHSRQWQRLDAQLSPADKAAVKKELDEFKTLSKKVQRDFLGVSLDNLEIDEFEKTLKKMRDLFDKINEKV